MAKYSQVRFLQPLLTDLSVTSQSNFKASCNFSDLFQSCMDTAFSFSLEFMTCCLCGVNYKTPTIFNKHKLILSSTARLKMLVFFFFLNGTTLTQALAVASGSGAASVYNAAWHSSSIALSLRLWEQLLLGGISKEWVKVALQVKRRHEWKLKWFSCSQDTAQNYAQSVAPAAYSILFNSWCFETPKLLLCRL